MAILPPIALVLALAEPPLDCAGPLTREIVVACVVADGTLNEAALDAHVRATLLADYKRPRLYLFMDELPKNAANKVLRRVLRERAAARPGAAWPM